MKNESVEPKTKVKKKIEIDNHTDQRTNLSDMINNIFAAKKKIWFIL